MMKSLEAKLKKNGLLNQFNLQLKEFMNTGIITPVTPSVSELQVTFIPLCYILANNSEATTKPILIPHSKVILKYTV